MRTARPLTRVFLVGMVAAGCSAPSGPPDGYVPPILERTMIGTVMRIEPGPGESGELGWLRLHMDLDPSNVITSSTPIGERPIVVSPAETETRIWVRDDEVGVATLDRVREGDYVRLWLGDREDIPCGGLCLMVVERVDLYSR